MFDQIVIDIKKLMELSERGELPVAKELVTTESYRDYLRSMFSGSVMDRRMYKTNYSFSIITKELVKEIVELIGNSKAIEIGAGSGWMAKHIRQTNPEIDYTTLDDGSWELEKYHIPIDISSSFVGFDFDPYDIVIYSWPPMSCTGLSDTLRDLKSGTLFLYCGEPCGGCTGDDDMFETLDEHFDLIDDLNSQITFEQLHDQWILYKRK